MKTTTSPHRAALRKPSQRQVQKTTEASATPALDRGLAVLELLGERRMPMRANDLAQALEIPNCSIGRILDTLTVRGYVERDARTMAYALTGKLLAMAAGTVCEKHLIEEAIGEMRALRDCSGETVQLNVLSGDRGVVLEVVPSRAQVRLAVDPGTPHSLHCAAPGKVLLSFLPERERTERLRRMILTRDTENTITDVKRLQAELERVASQGYSVDRQETLLGVNCLSAPIFDRTCACVAALTLSGPSMRMPVRRFPEFASQVMEHAARISERLGYHVPSRPKSIN